MIKSNKLLGFYGFLTIFVITFASINTTIAATSVLDETDQTIANESYFTYQATGSPNTKFYVDLTSSVPIDFFIVDFNNGEIYQDLFGVVDKGKTFDDIDFLFDSYSENITTKSFSFKDTKQVEMKFIIDNSNLAGVFADTDAVVSLKITSTRSLPGFQIPLALFAIVLSVVIIRVVKK